jgi:hypothetical protein
MQPGVDTGQPFVCNVPADCTLDGGGIAHLERTCDLTTHSCVQLTTDECPFVIGDWRQQQMLGPPIFIGAFATIPNSAPTADPTYENYELAISEFTTYGKGVPAGALPNVTKRTPLAIVCNDALPDQATYDKAMRHLINDLHTPVVVAPLPSGVLATTFTNDVLNNDAGTALVINPLAADSTIIPPALISNGLLWHDQGAPADYAPAYGAFFPTVERYVRGLHQLGPAPDGGSKTPMKVAVVTSQNSIDLADLAAAAKPWLTWNGQSLQANQAAGNYYEGTILDTTLNGANPSKIDYSQVVGQLVTFQPDVIVAFGSEEVYNMLQLLEIQWSTGPRPFYLLSPYIAGYPPLLQWIYQTCANNGVDTLETCRTRFAGINAASTTDTQDLADYESRFLTLFPQGQSSLGWENLYDAMYLAVYSLVASGRQFEPNGARASMGMTQLISTATKETEGPVDMGTIFGTLGQGSPISLYGPLGAPNFNMNQGARVGVGDVYCLGKPDAGGGVPPYNYDVLRLVDPAAPDAGLTATGTLCTTDGGF